MTRLPASRRQAVRLLALALASAGAGTAGAEATQVSAAGFTVVHEAAVDADPARVWQAFTELPRWWSDAHSWSGRAAHMQLEPRAGGCWCETWGDGASAQHGRVVLVQPGSALRLQAWLGPLQGLPVQGVLTFGTARRDGATRLRVTYAVAGPASAGLDQLAPAVDGVIGEQFARLKRYVETGRPQ